MRVHVEAGLIVPGLAPNAPTLGYARLRYRPQAERAAHVCYTLVLKPYLFVTGEYQNVERYMYDTVVTFQVEWFPRMVVTDVHNLAQAIVTVPRPPGTLVRIPSAHGKFYYYFMVSQVSIGDRSYSGIILIGLLEYDIVSLGRCWRQVEKKRRDEGWERGACPAGRYVAHSLGGLHLVHSPPRLLKTRFLNRPLTLRIKQTI
ncbi:hypothetical protein AAG570_008479 [Ranatra chinensis]|uniref:Uncharacterized protein n=1 Tax=Ranatra chinensis TaxID=642074 RepID=A0ABD0YRB3_9HEMI